MVQRYNLIACHWHCLQGNWSHQDTYFQATTAVEVLKALSSLRGYHKDRIVFVIERNYRLYYCLLVGHAVTKLSAPQDHRQAVERSATPAYGQTVKTRIQTIEKCPSIKPRQGRQRINPQTHIVHRIVCHKHQGTFYIPLEMIVLCDDSLVHEYTGSSFLIRKD